MLKEFRKDITWGGRALSLESGKIARQADGAVLATLGETKVLCTVVYEKTPKASLDFFPLSVHYQEKSFAAGQDSRRLLQARGPSGGERDPDIAPDRPADPAAVRQGLSQRDAGDLHRVEPRPGERSGHRRSGRHVGGADAIGRAVPRPGRRMPGRLHQRRIRAQPAARRDRRRAHLDLVVAGTRDGVLMVESEAKELSEEIMLGAVMFGHRNFQPVIDAIIDLAEACAKEPLDLPPAPAGLDVLSERVRGLAEADLAEAYSETVKATRRGKVAAIKERVYAALSEDETVDKMLVFERLDEVFKDVEKNVVRRRILAEGQRIDGRDTRTRPADRRGGGVAASGARQRAVHPRRDTGIGRYHARNRSGRADRRRSGGRVPRALHAALQLPAVLGGRGRQVRLHRPARGRARQAGMAIDPSVDARQGGLPLHHQGGVGDHRIRTARHRWRPCAARRCR